MRRRFDRDGPHHAPTALPGSLPQQLHPSEVLAWRQDRGLIHPTSTCALAHPREAMAIPV